MATKTSQQVSAGVQPSILRVGLQRVFATFSLDASLSNGDVVQMLKVPVNARVMDVTLGYQSNGQGSLIVGDGIDTDRYIAASLMSSGVSVHRMNGAFTGYLYSADDTIDVTISASAQPSSGAIYMWADIQYAGV